MSQETERYQLENNGNTYLARASASGGDTDVEANPEGTATTDLEKLKVGETIYGIPEGTEVVANPTLAGTESALTGLQVGDTKYAVESGMTNPMTTAGDLIVGGTDGVPTRIAGQTAASGYSLFFTIGNATTPLWTYASPSMLMSRDNTKHSVPYNPNTTGTANMSMGTIGNTIPLYPITTAPTANNTDGLKIVVLTSEPATYYDGYYSILAPTP